MQEVIDPCTTSACARHAGRSYVKHVPFATTCAFARWVHLHRYLAEAINKVNAIAISGVFVHCRR